MLMQMEHEALTLSDELKELFEDATRAGEFATRSGATRTILPEYFEIDVERTAALVATGDSADFESVLTVLDVGVERFAERVQAINVDAVPDRLSFHLEQDDASGRIPC